MTLLGWILIAPSIVAIIYWLTPVFAFLIGKRRVTLKVKVASTGKSSKYVFYHEKGDDLDLLLNEISAGGS